MVSLTKRGRKRITVYTAERGNEGKRTSRKQQSSCCTLRKTPKDLGSGKHLKKSKGSKEAALWKKSVNHMWMLETGPAPEDICHPVCTMPRSR